MSRYVPVLHPLIGLAMSGAWFVQGLRALRRKRLIEDTGTSGAAAAAVGKVELAGVAEPLPGGAVRGPFSGVDCAFLAWSVEQKKGRDWETIKSQPATPFLLRDDSGAILVDPNEADIEIAESEIESRFGKDPPPHVQTFCRAHGIAWEGGLGANHRMRFVERRIPRGGAVYVLGSALREARGETLHRLGVVANSLVVGRGAHERTLVVSDTEKHARASLLHGSLLGIWVGGAAIVLCVLLLVNDVGGFR